MYGSRWSPPEPIIAFPFTVSMNHETPAAKKTFTGSLQSAAASSGVHFAISTMRGRRATQEDTCIIQTELHGGDSAQILPDHALFAVFDGHGTSFASEYASDHFVSTFCNQQSFVEYSKRLLDDTPKKSRSRPKKCNTPKHINDTELLQDAIESTMLLIDAQMLEKMNRIKEKNDISIDGEFDVSDSGTTAIIILLTPDHIICANLGDSRAMLKRGDKGNAHSTMSLSTDHKPSNEGEGARICKAGGIVLGGKIDARLAVSRGLGDFDFKHQQSIIEAATILDKSDTTPSDDYVKPEDQMVSPVPETIVLPRDDANDKFLVLATDGIWDVVSNDKCANLISSIFEEGEQNVALACEELLDHCYAKGSLDNMTAILIRFASQEIGCGGGIMMRRKLRKRN